jgi:hypothetical protein
MEKKGRKNREEKLRQRRRKREKGCVSKEEHETKRGKKTRLGKKSFFFGVESLEILLKRFFRTMVYRTLSSSFSYLHLPFLKYRLS